MKKIAILQSNYIPWKGYFDIISKVDLFIFHDDLQYTSGDWRNRNKIKNPNGLQWLTIPCGTSEKRLICDVKLDDHSWQKKHWSIIKNNYHKAPYFGKYEDFFAAFYLDNIWTNLSDANQSLIKAISRDILKLETIFEDSGKYSLVQKKGERVIELLNHCNADIYLSGPSAKSYLKPQMFNQNHIELTYIDYSTYPVYQQLYPPFIHEVSIIDLLFHVGDNFASYCFS
jgi:hypothetical protein